MEIFQSTPPLLFARMAIMVFFAILFLQSGWDKILDRKGNLDWMVPHFANSPIKKLVPFLLSIVTVVELFAGVACAWAIYSISWYFIEPPHFSHEGAQTSSMLSYSSFPEMNLALCIVAVALLQLFLGQRLAKDYPGAASLATYFGVAILGFVVASTSTGPFVMP